MKNSPYTNTDTTLRAAGSVLGLLPQITGLAVGFTGLAYIIGWKESSAYYRELGAPWASSMLTSVQIMQTSISLITIIFAIAFCSFVALLENKAGMKGLRRWSIFFLVLASITYCSSFIFDKHVSSNLLVGITGFFWAIATGTTVGELIACLALRELKWSGYEVYLLYFILAFGIFYAPILTGESRAKIDADFTSNRLPTVRLNENKINEWKLLGPCGDNFLLITQSTDKKGRLFKVVAAESISEIKATAR
ncbi:hypothetical protein [Enterobacter hormaechei]|uniref:hypothetical protein n=1 Tax=Enterobacter hormaechei TaxID=158836 RepID=UPI0032DB310F